MRDGTEVRERIEHVRETRLDVLGFRTEALAEFLPWANATNPPGLVKEDAEPWEEPTMTREAVVACMRDYMAFAWGKVGDERGISANRSVEKMEEWLWLISDEDDEALLKEYRATDYYAYGAPQLAIICRALDFPMPEEWK